jgi:(2Fe-2S) ferredoxin
MQIRYIAVAISKLKPASYITNGSVVCSLFSLSFSFLPNQRRLIQVCQNRTCLRSYSDQVLAAFQAHCSVGVMVTGSECLGQCSSGPTVKVMPDNVWYCRVRPDDVDEIIEQHCQAGHPVKRLLHPRFHPDYSASGALISDGDALDRDALEGDALEGDANQILPTAEEPGL